MRFPRLLTPVLTACIIGSACFAADPATLGFDPERLARLDTTLQASVEQQELAGGVMYVARDGQIVQLKPFGYRDVEAKQPMTADTIFRIASMSKAVTSVAIMMLYEEGRLMMHDPVSKFIPGFKNSVVAVPPPAGSSPGTPYTTVPVKRPIQIRDLLTHMAGLTYGDGPAVEDYKRAGLHGWYFADKDETLADVIDRLARLPLHGQPGEAWQYGYATDVLGRVVEVVSGQPLDEFFATRIFAPLQMPDTCFFLPRDKVNRLAKVYGREGGRLVVGSQGHYVDGPRKCFSGGAGLLSTAADYGRLLQMLLNGGTLDGARVLSPKSVQLMTANHTGDKYGGDRGAFGLGFWVTTDVGAAGELGSEGAYGWGSAYFPQYVVDPKERLVAFLMTQLMPAGGSNLNQRIKVLTYQALVR